MYHGNFTVDTKVHCLLTRYFALSFTAHVDDKSRFIFMIRRWTSKFVIQIICKPVSRYLWCHLLFSEFLIFSSLGRVIDSETSCKRHVCHQLFVRNCIYSINYMCWQYECEFIYGILLSLIILKQTLSLPPSKHNKS